jgi:hypothetical protein
MGGGFSFERLSVEVLLMMSVYLTKLCDKAAACMREEGLNDRGGDIGSHAESAQDHG